MLTVDGCPPCNRHPRLCIRNEGMRCKVFFSSPISLSLFLCLFICHSLPLSSFLSLHCRAINREFSLWRLYNRGAGDRETGSIYAWKWSGWRDQSMERNEVGWWVDEVRTEEKGHIAGMKRNCWAVLKRGKKRDVDKVKLNSVMWKNSGQTKRVEGALEKSALSVVRWQARRRKQWIHVGPDSVSRRTSHSARRLSVTSCFKCLLWSHW